MSLRGYELDCAGSERYIAQRGDRLIGDAAVRESGTPEDLSDFYCVRNGGTELASDCDEIVPDSDDDELGRQDAMGEACPIFFSGLGTDTMLEKSNRLENQGHFFNSVVAEVEEQGTVADSEEDEGNMKQIGKSAHGRQVKALNFSANAGLDGDLLKHPFMAGGGRILNKHGILFGNRDINKKTTECLNKSQLPIETSLADTSKFVDNFSKCNGFELLSKGGSKSYVKQPSPSNSCSNGVQILGQEISCRTAAARFSSNTWIDMEPNKQGKLSSKSDVLFYSRRRKRCTTTKAVITTMKSDDINLCCVSGNHQENKEVASPCHETNGKGQTGKPLFYGSEEVNHFSEEPKSATLIIDQDLNVKTCLKQGDKVTDDGGENETFDDVFNTQAAAAVLETLSVEPPKGCGGYVLSDIFQATITDNPKDTMEKEAKLGSSSLQNGKFSGLRQNGERLKRKKRTYGEAVSDKSVFYEHDFQKGRHVDSHCSFKKEDKPCNEKNVSEKLFQRPSMERNGNQAASECIKVVCEGSHIISLDSERCSSLSKCDFDAKFSTSLSKQKWMSKAQRSLGLEKKFGTKDLVNTYKRRRSAMVRKENRSPNVSFDLAEVKSSIESTKEPVEQSHVIPFGCIDINKLIIPKGKRTSRGSRNVKDLDSVSNVRSEADTEKEVKCPLAKRSTNHCAEPGWLKFSRKRRTSAACDKQGEGVDSCKAKLSKRFSSDSNEPRLCVGQGVNDAIIDDSRTFYDSNSLTSVSNNSRIVPPVSNLNSGYCANSRPNKMSRSSVFRELVHLHFSEIPYDSSCKNLRRRKHVVNVRVLLSQHLDTDTIMQQKRVMVRLGISIATCASEATHFVTNTFSRTKNMLEAIALAIPVVTELWLENCALTGCLVDEKRCILKDAKKEKEIGFSLSASLAKAARYPLLKDCKVFITANIKPDMGMLIGLVKMVQGEVLEITKNCKIPEDVIVLSCQEDHALCMPFIEKGIPIYNSELLLNGIVTQKLELIRHQLFND